MDMIWERIKETAENNNGFIKTGQVEELGISRPMIKRYRDLGYLEQIRKGLYILADGIADEYALLQAQSNKAIFSYGTALYLWKMSDRTPHVLDVTLPQGSNVSRIKRDNPNLRCHYVRSDVHEMGISEVKSPQGAVVKLYDKERCICDLIRDKNQVDLQLYTQAIKEYFKAKPDYRRLLKYSKVFDIEEKVRTYMEVL